MAERARGFVGRLYGTGDLLPDDVVIERLRGGQHASLEARAEAERLIREAHGLDSLQLGELIAALDAGTADANLLDAIGPPAWALVRLLAGPLPTSELHEMVGFRDWITEDARRTARRVRARRPSPAAPPPSPPGPEPA